MQAMRIYPETAYMRPHLLRQDDMDAFMDTFDSAITVSAESFDKWCMRNDVRQCKFDCQDYMLMSFMGLSTHMKDPFNRADLLEAAYFLGCLFHGSEEGYLEWYETLFIHT